MKKLSKILALMLALTLVLSLVACDGSGKDGGKKNAADTLTVFGNIGSAEGPTVIDEMIIEGFKEKSFSVFIERFISYFVMVLCIYAVTFLTAIITYNVALLVTVPFASVLLITVRFVDYYAPPKR